MTLREHGAKVGILDLGEEDAFASAYPDRTNLAYAKADITKRTQVESALGAFTSKLGTPFGLVNCAALDSPPNASAEENGPFETYPVESLERVLSVNVTGATICMQVFGEQMAKQGAGSIVNIGSIYGLVSPNQTIYEYRRERGEDFYKPVAYAASKSALYNLTRYAATYWALKGVRVNTLTLAGVFNNQAPEFLEAYCAQMPIGRMAKEDEYNGAVVFLMSEASAYMTGANLVMDGGWTAW